MDLDPSTAVSDPASSYRADWYPDPTARYEFRYHNGRAWTGDVSVDGRRFLDPLSLVGPQAFAPRPGFAPASTPLEPIGKSLAAFVLGVCSVLAGWVPFLCIITAIGAIVGFSFGVSALRKDARSRRAGGSNHRGHGYALTGVILAPFGLALAGVGVWLSVLALREVDEYTNIGAHTTSVTTCDVSDGEVRAAGTITNNSTKDRDYHLVIDFDRPGTSVRRAGTSTDVVDVAPGETAPWAVTERLSDDDADCVVADVTGPLPFQS